MKRLHALPLACIVLALGASRRVFALLDRRPEVTDRPGARAVPRVAGRLTFDRVTFGYGRGANVLHDMIARPSPTRVIRWSPGERSNLENEVPVPMMPSRSENQTSWLPVKFSPVSSTPPLPKKRIETPDSKVEPPVGESILTVTVKSAPDKTLI